MGLVFYLVYEIDSLLAQLITSENYSYNYQGLDLNSSTPLHMTPSH
jgi:hypothetical protein